MNRQQGMTPERHRWRMPAKPGAGWAGDVVGRHGAAAISNVITVGS
jgi:hypothetical protein